MTFQNAIIRLALAALLFVLSGLPAPSAAEMSIQDTNCRKALALGMGKLAAKVLSEMETCHQARMRGEVWDDAHQMWVVPNSRYFRGNPSKVDCRDLTRLPSASIKRIGRAEHTLNMLARGRCIPPVSPPAALGYALCPSPCDTVAITDYNSVATCLACRVKSDSLAMNPDILQCHSSLGYALQNYMSARFEEQRRCQSRGDQGESPNTDCMTADPNGRIAAARTRMQELVNQCMAECGGALSDSMFVCVYE